MDIYYTKKQTENIPRSCSYLLLKTLFYFISQCTSVPYLESGLCKGALAIRRIFSLVDMITKPKFSNCPNVFKIGLFR